MSFEEAALALDLDVLSYLFAHHPQEQSHRMAERIKLAAKLLARAVGLQQSKALEAVAQAIRFRTWHDLSSHLVRGQEAAPQALPTGWLDALSAAVVLMVIVEDDVTMPAARVEAFEQFGQTLAMLTDAPKQVVLDAVSAHLCAAKTWTEVRGRSPLKAKAALYTFVAAMPHEEAGLGGYFEESPACRQLTEELDDQWQGYEQLTKVEKRHARKWVEHALASQPGFLEGGLSLAWMQHEAGQGEASATADRFIRQAEALIPAGYKGPIAWANTGNRFYHRLLWLRLKLNHVASDLPSAVKVARKQLRLNPNDNLGVRYVMPLMLLEQGEHVAARRAAAKHLDGEYGHTAGAIRAFCEYAIDNQAGFRQALVGALISLPWLRRFLLNQRAPLPEGDDGIRGLRPDTETFDEFAWPAYCAVPGLRKSCESFLAEPLVLQAEDELRRYWKGYWVDRYGVRIGTSEGWNALVSSWTDRLLPVPPPVALRRAGHGGRGTGTGGLSRRRFEPTS
jgi:hypothetical protein